MELLIAKILAALSLVFIGIASGLLPYRVSMSANAEKWLQYGNGFAGGIFVGAGLLHLMPDADELLSTLPDAPEYPIAFLLAGIGFLLVLLLEQVMLHGQEEEDLAVDQESFPIVLFLILSIHSFIAGTAMGLESSASALLAVFIAIVAHKAFAALALGIALVDGQVPLRRIVQTVVAFSLMTPFGILVGTVFSEVLESNAAQAMEGTFDGLAAGTFIYIATFEMIGVVFETKVNRIQKFLFVVFGFIAMALLAVWA